MSEFQLHPLCTLFPRMDGKEFDALVADISANGLRQRITLHNSMILDGGNRYRACLAAGVEPEFEIFDGENIVLFVLSANLHRRHLAVGQAATITALAQNWADAQLVGRPKESGNVAPLSKVSDRAAQSGASPRTQKQADKIAREAPEVARQVGRGEKTLAQATEEVTGKVRATKTPDPEPTADESAELRDHIAEMTQSMQQLMDENKSMLAVFQADDKLAAALVEIKRLTEVNRILEERLRGLMNEVAAAKQAAVRHQKRADKCEKVAKI